jgi:iron complex outermembrane receptor protein
MPKAIQMRAALTVAMCIIICSGPVWATNIDIPAGELSTALDAYSAETGIHLLYADDTVRGLRSGGIKGNISADVALTRLLSGTGLVIHRHGSGEVTIVRDEHANNASLSIDVAASPAPAANGALETVTVTSSKIGGDVQNIPISITALSQEQLTATQTAGGPDLIKQVPNMTFTKTNFTGYSIQIRGIGTQAISVTTDPAVAVAFNDIPFIRNHFFEQEFYDVASVEVARGPQGTLYGRNATAGVVNLVSAKPSDQFEAMASVDIGNYQNRRMEGMINIPIVDDKLDIRVAGEWTKRQGYSLNEETDDRIDGRDLWSGRVSIGLKPIQNLQMNLVWEHFSEDDDRLRSAKQLCKTDYGPGYTPLPNGNINNAAGTVNIGGVLKPVGPAWGNSGDYFTQGCSPASLYSPDSFQAPLGYALPYILGLQFESDANNINPYASETQSHNLRVIDSGLNPVYKAKSDVIELNSDYALTPALTFSSQTGFGNDFLFSAEDFNRFGAAPGLFAYTSPNGQQQFNGVGPDPSGAHVCTFFFCGTIGAPCAASEPGCVPAGYFCDPQVGCSDRLILEDLATEHSWQLSQEFRLASNFSGPFNFTVGGNYLHYETYERYYVFGNVLTLINGGFVPGEFNSNTDNPLRHGFQYPDPNNPLFGQGYVDPNPISHLNNNGHNYFLSDNPYVLNSYAAFGEANYSLLDDLKLTGGLRWTEDQKHFVDIPSWLLESGWGFPVEGVVNQQWDQLTGRAVANWTPKLDFTDQTLIYGSYAHGYKAGGANPPGAMYPSVAGDSNVYVEPTHPLTFKPEFVDAFELGTKNTLLDGALTLNGDVFYYNYENYQISQIVDRTAINLNFDAHAKGAELEATWEPVPGLRFNFSGGWEDTAIAQGESAVDLIDRTAGTPGWVVVKPFANESSNCIFPTYVAALIINGSPGIGADATSYCAYAYILHDDPITQLPYKADPTEQVLGGGLIPCCQNPDGVPITGYRGFDPSAAPNNGTGFSKNLGGNQLPNAPPYTVSFGAQYTMPLSANWAGTLRGDYYWQDSSWWRVFNDLSYDRLHGYDTLNLTLIFTSQSGWQVMLYDKNVFNTTAITGAFLNSDDTGLTTNVFLTDPKLIGIRVTKNW